MGGTREEVPDQLGMSCFQGLPVSLLKDIATIRRPVTTFTAPGSRKPVFKFENVETGRPCRFDSMSTQLTRTNLGQVAKKFFKVFMNLPAEVKENYEIVNEADGQVFQVNEVKNVFGHHLEMMIEEKQK